MLVTPRALSPKPPVWASFIAVECASPRSAACAASGVVQAVKVYLRRPMEAKQVPR